MKTTILLLLISISSFGQGNFFWSHSRLKPTAWEVPTAIYTNLDVPVTPESDATCLDIVFSADGTKMYTSSTGSKYIYQYALSTAWDISTATYSGTKKLLLEMYIGAYGIRFNSTGTKFYAMDASSTNHRIYQYSLSTAWDITSASYSGLSFDFSAQAGTATDMTFSADCSKLYVLDYGTATIYQYNLSSAENISTSLYSSKSFGTSNQENQLYNLEFKANGTDLYIVGRTSGRIFQYSLSTAWDVSTTTYNGKSVGTISQTLYPGGLYIKPDGTMMYLLGAESDRVYQYRMTTN